METAEHITSNRVDNSLRLQWQFQQAINYGVRIIFDEEGVQNEVKYQVRVTRMQPAPDGSAQFQIERTSDVFINETVPDLVADRLAYTAGKVFYPLIIALDKNGGFSTITNHQPILKRWEKTKTEILDNFEGPLVENYVARMQKQLMLREQVQQALINNDWFLQTFFKPIYKAYGADYISESVYRFPIIKTLMIDGYATKEKLNPYTNDFGAVELTHTGELASAEEEAINVVMETGNYEGNYVLHPQTRHILSIVSSFDFHDQKTTSVKVKIFMIPANGQPFDEDFTSQKAGSQQVQQSGLVIIDGSPKRSFWDKLLDI